MYECYVIAVNKRYHMYTNVYSTRYELFLHEKLSLLGLSWMDLPEV